MRPTAPAKFTESGIPADIAARAQEYREKLVEAVAESDEKLMEKFFDSGTLSDEELICGPEKAGRRRKDLSGRFTRRRRQISEFRSC